MLCEGKPHMHKKYYNTMYNKQLNLFSIQKQCSYVQKTTMHKYKEIATALQRLADKCRA